jgi:alginate production protein
VGGLRASGKEPFTQDSELSYWADFAVVLGNEKLLDFDDAADNKKLVVSRQKQRVHGWAIDVGARWDTQLPGQPLFTLGYAIGSGDKNPGKGSDRAFRQTGLQSTDEEFRTYGEILRPSFRT